MIMVFVCSSLSEWYTSGQLIGNVVKWNGDGTYSNDTANNNAYWIQTDSKFHSRDDRIIYKFACKSPTYIHFYK